MFEFVTADENLPFSVALAVMFGIAILEGVLTVIGFGLSNVIDSLLPDHDFDPHIDFDPAGEVHGDIHGEIGSQSALSKLLSWLRVGKVPVLMLLVVFLTAFGLIGLSLQGFIHGVTGSMLPAAIASIPAFLLSLPVVRVMGSVIAVVMPQDETEAVGRETLVGRIGIITLGTARQGHAAEARVRDAHGTSHYVMVEPNVAEEFTRGDQVLLVKDEGAVFKVIKNISSSLVDEQN